MSRRSGSRTRRLMRDEVPFGHRAHKRLGEPLKPPYEAPTDQEMAVRLGRAAREAIAQGWPGEAAFWARLAYRSARRVLAAEGWDDHA